MTESAPLLQKQADGRRATATDAQRAPLDVDRAGVPVSSLPAGLLTAVGAVPLGFHLSGDAPSGSGRVLAALRRSPAPPADDPLGGTPASGDVVEGLRRTRGGGRALPADLGGRIGQELGVDLSGVRVHTDGTADRLARSVQSVAFTSGSDVYFRSGTYSPESAGGQRLLAHELSHVADPAGVGTANSGTVIGRADDPAEARADASADRVLKALRRRADPDADRTTEAADGHRPDVARLRVPELRRAVLHRLIDMKTPAGTSVTREGQRFTVIGPVSDPTLGRMLSLRCEDDQSIWNVAPRALPQYDVAGPALGGPGVPDPLASSLASTGGGGIPDPPDPVVTVVDPGPGVSSTGIPTAPPDTGIPTAPLETGIPTAPLNGGPGGKSGAPTSAPKKPLGPPKKLGGPGVGGTSPALSPSTGSGPDPTTPEPVPTSGAVTPGQLAALTVDVPPETLDEGSKLLQQMRLARPQKVNDAGADKLSNCAIATIAAITGAGTSGAATQDVRTSQGVPVDKRAAQSEKLWTIALLDAELMKQSSFVLADTPKRAKDLDDTSFGRSYVLGSAQYHLMLKYLAGKATAGGDKETIRRHGLPGGTMYDEATLLGAMRNYPNGTRFAVFVHSNDPSQHVQAHWVYAEKFNGKVIFQDFQTNTALATPADAYLEKFPFSPDKKNDAGKGFAEGCFIAVAPTPEAGESLPDPEIEASEIDAEIAEAQAYALAWSEKLGKKTPTMASTWSLPGGKRLDQIPAPVAIQNGYASVTGRLGVAAKSRFDITKPGVITIVGHPHLKKIGKLAKVEFDNLNASTKVKVPGQAAAVDPLALAPRAPVDPGKYSDEATDNQETAFSKSYNVMAQNTSKGIEINAERGEFTDLIHEAAHAYEAGELPAHIREGLADVFASMVSQDILQTSKDPSFAFDYNPAYAPFVVAVEKLIAALGLTALASLYFEAASPRDALKKTITEKTGAADAGAASIVDQLFNDNFPTGFEQGLAEILTKQSTFVPVASTTPQTPEEIALAEKQASVEKEVYDTRKASFATFLEAKRAGLETKGLKKGAGLMELAEALDTQYGKDVMELRLGLLYTHLDETEGQAFQETMNLVFMHEMGIGKVTGEDAEAVRQRINGTTKL